ncbi:unnamed protein product [Rhizoctonia solani]|uniref:Uncharacterized protein n=1 Tax=Rhizoctonia solani TaxID=456999 RepID=A0A8H3I0F3_9AGAM|nr:unnamed protein product [Rhizoctonia solani]
MDPNPTPDPAPDAPSRSGPEPDLSSEHAPLEATTATPQAVPTDTPQLDVKEADLGDRSKDETPAAHITRSPSPANDAVPDPMDQDSTDKAPERAPSSEASAEAPHSPDPSTEDPAPTSPQASSPQPTPVPQAPAVPPVYTTHLPLTMVQTAVDGQNLTARQLGQRARRARERELQAQGLYTPKRRTSSSATMSDLPVSQPPASADVTMQSADEGGDDDGEGELESEINATSTPSVPPHSASHLIPPIAVLAPVTTPSRASLAQRARRERERATRLGITPSPGGSPDALATSSQPISFNPTQGVQPQTLTRGQLAQRARRARERVERAAKSPNGAPMGETWTPSLGSADGSGGMSSAGEAVFAVAPPPPGFSTSTPIQTSPQAGYGVGLGAAHVPQQLNRAQLAQRARRARERQQRLSLASAHSAGIHPTSPLTKDHARSDSGSVPPSSPTRHVNDSPARTSLSPMTSSTADTPAPINIGAQFDQVFKSLTAGDNGVSRAVAGSGAGVLTSGGRTSSPAERITSPSVLVSKTTEAKIEEPMELDAAEENVDQLSDEPVRSPTPPPASTLRPPTPPIQTVSSPKPQPEVHRSAVQSVGA